MVCGSTLRMALLLTLQWPSLALIRKAVPYAWVCPYSAYRCKEISLTLPDDVPVTYADYVARRKCIEKPTGGPSGVGAVLPAVYDHRLGQRLAQSKEPSELSEQTRDNELAVEHLALRIEADMALLGRKVLHGRAVPAGMGGREDEETNQYKLLLQKVKDAGVAGIISYGVVQLAFFGASIPIGIFAYYKVAGHWPDLSNAEDQAQLAAEAFAFLNLARLAIPLRIALALSMTQGVQTNIVNRFQKKQ